MAALVSCTVTLGAAKRIPSAANASIRRRRSLVESGDYRVTSRLEPQSEYHPPDSSPKLIAAVVGRTNSKGERVRRPPARRFVPDSPLEEEGFEPLVPPSKRTAIPSSILRFFAAIVLISENDDFELPESRSNLARRAT